MPPGGAQGHPTPLEVRHLPSSYQLKGPSRTGIVHSTSVRASCPEALSPTSHLTNCLKNYSRSNYKEQKPFKVKRGLWAPNLLQTRSRLRTHGLFIMKKKG